MHKAIYLDIFIHVQNTKNSPLDDKVALNEVDQLIRTMAHSAGTGLSIDVKRVRPENSADHSEVDITVLIYLEAEQEAASSFTTFATSAVEGILLNTFKQPTPSGLSVTLRSIEEDTDAVDELSDECDEAKS